MIHGGSGVKPSQVVNCEVVVGGEHVIASFPRDMLIRAVPAWVKVGRNAVPRPTNSAISVPGPKQAIILAGMHVPRPQKKTSLCILCLCPFLGAIVQRFAVLNIVDYNNRMRESHLPALFSFVINLLIFSLKSWYILFNMQILEGPAKKVVA